MLLIVIKVLKNRLRNCDLEGNVKVFRVITTITLTVLVAFVSHFPQYKGTQ